MRRFGRGRDKADTFPKLNESKKEKFIYQWNDHIHDLARLKYTLPRKYHSELDEIMSHLSILITLAGDEIKD